MPTHLPTWPDILRTAIRTSGKTTYAIAKESGVPVQTVDRIVDGQEPRLGTAERIAAVVGVVLRARKRQHVGETGEQ